MPWFDLSGRDTLFEHEGVDVYAEPPRDHENHIPGVDIAFSLARRLLVSTA